MASWPPKKNTAFTFYVGLISQANTKIAQANPTLAAGDVKVAVDDAAPANLTTLPVVDADFTKRVKVAMSAAEMNGDRITIIFSDAAGAEWCDLVIDLPTSVRQTDDLTFPNVSGRGIDVDATGGVEITTGQAVGSVTGAVGSVTADVGITQAGADKVWATTTRALTDKVGFALSAAGVQAIWDALTSALTTVGSVGKKLADWALGSDNRVLVSADAHTSGETVANMTNKTGMAVAAGGIGAGAHAAAELNAIADATLDRNMATGTDSGTDSTAVRTPRQALRVLRNKNAIAAGTMTVSKEDDVTASFTAAVVTTAGNPISSVDPT